MPQHRATAFSITLFTWIIVHIIRLGKHEHASSSRKFTYLMLFKSACSRGLTWIASCPRPKYSIAVTPHHFGWPGHWFVFQSELYIWPRHYGWNNYARIEGKFSTQLDSIVIQLRRGRLCVRNKRKPNKCWVGATTLMGPNAADRLNNTHTRTKRPADRGRVFVIRRDATTKLATINFVVMCVRV